MRRFVVTQTTKFFLLEDDHNASRNEKMYAIVKSFLPLTDDPARASCFVVIGGDGSMLHAVRHPERRNKPILAINGGTVGRTLMDADEHALPFVLKRMMANQCHLMQFPVIQAVATSVCGAVKSFLAFNDVWADRLSARSVKYDMSIKHATGDAGEISVIDGHISGDGILACTPIGSTAYARMLGEMVLPLNTNSFLITPMSSMSQKRRVHAFALSDDQTLCVRFEDTDFRPNRLAVDGVYVEMNGKTINVKTLELSILNTSERSVDLIVDDPASFLKKQIDFIAR